MKKILSLLFATLFLCALPACNEDNTENDAPLTAQLMGSWILEHSDANNKITSSLYYRFQNNQFTYTVTEMNNVEATMRTWSVQGGWNIQKGYLQLNYNIDTFRAEGYTDTEVRTIRASLIDNNNLLAEMNKKGRPFGVTISFSSANGNTVLIIDGINGYFNKTAF